MARQTDHVPPMTPPVAAQLLNAVRQMSTSLAMLRFVPPVALVYNPLQYSSAPYEA